MISADSSFITAVAGNARHFAAKIIHNSSEVQCDIIKITASKGAQDGQTFTVGSVFSSSAEITCAGLSDNLENEDIILQIGIQTGDSTYSYITYGQYTVIKAQKTAYQAVLTCVGFISSKFNILLPDTAANPSISSIASAIQATTGITLTIPAAGAGNTLAKALTGVTCRTALSIIAFLLGGYATENASGGVEIHTYILPQERVSVLAENCLHAPVVAEDSFTMTGVKVVVEENVYELTSDTTVITGKTYYTRSGSGTSEDPYIYTAVDNPTGNPAAEGWYEVGEIAYSYGNPIRQTYFSPYMTQTVFNSFASTVVGLTFMPAEIDMSLGDPRVEPWDCLTVTDIDGQTIYTVPCHNLQSSFDGGFSLRVLSIGESLSDPVVEGSITKRVTDAVEQLAVTQAAAEQAKAAAAQAKQTTDEINAYATLAGKTVTQILNDGETAGTMAQQAQQSAQDAQQSASTAYNYASVAINQLSVVEDIVGVLDLVANNGTYARTQDETAQPDKWYFIYNGTAYEVAVSPTFEYVLTSDSTIVAGKPYYTRSGSGTEQDPYTYTQVETPVQADIGTYYEYTNWYYYELTGIDQTIQNYVSSHLVLAGDSLFLQTDDGEGSTRLELNTTNGLTLYDQNGSQVARYGSDAVIGNENDFHITVTSNYYATVYNPTGDPSSQGWYELDNGEYVLTEDTTVASGKTYYQREQRLSFYRGPSTPANEVAYISGDRLYITQSVVLQQMDIGTPANVGGLGQWSWKVHEVDGQNNLYLKWLG